MPDINKVEMSNYDLEKELGTESILQDLARNEFDDTYSIVDNEEIEDNDDEVEMSNYDLEKELGTESILQDLARNEIIQLYWSLKSYNPEIISDELSELITNYNKLINVLINPVENSADFMLLLSFLNEKQSQEVEKIRLSTYEQILKFCGEKFETLPEIQALLPPSGLAELCNKIMQFYHEYDPYNLKADKLGFGQFKENALKDDKTLNYHNADFSPVFRDLHAITTNKNTPENRKKEAMDLIDSLRNYMNDPVQDSIYVLLTQPNKNGEWAKIENSLESIDGVSYYIEGDKIYKPIGNNILAISQRNAKANQLAKNRTIVKINGDVLGVARGPILFLAIDEKENIVNMTQSQQDWVMKNYFESQTFETYPVSSDRSKELLFNIFQVIKLSEKNPYSILRSYGFSESEIKNFDKYERV